jgi:hypothetical protein
MIIEQQDSRTGWDLTTLKLVNRILGDDWPLAYAIAVQNRERTAASPITEAIIDYDMDWI